MACRFAGDSERGRPFLLTAMLPLRCLLPSGCSAPESGPSGTWGGTLPVAATCWAACSSCLGVALPLCTAKYVVDVHMLRIASNYNGADTAQWRLTEEQSIQACLFVLCLAWPGLLLCRGGDLPVASKLVESNLLSSPEFRMQPPRPPFQSCS